MSSSQKRRYDKERKLNYRKVFAVIIAVAVLIMIISTIIKTIRTSTEFITATNNKTFFTFYSNNKWGVIDEQGQSLIPPVYEEMIIIPNKEKAIFICTYDVNDKDGTYKTKAVNERNEEILKGYDKIEAIDNYDSKQNVWYENNILRVSKNGKYGLINFDGKELLGCEYDGITALIGVKGNLIVRQGTKLGLVNELGQTIIPTEYKNILALKEGYKNEYVVVNNSNQYGLISTSGTAIFEPKYEEIRYVGSSEVYVVKEKGVLKLVDTSGEVIINGGYNNITHSKGEFTIVVKDGKYGLINTDEGKDAILPSYQELTYAFSNYYIAKKDGKYGLVDTLNATKIPFKYTDISYVENGGFIQADETATKTVLFNSELKETAVSGIISEINEEKGYIVAYVNGEYKYYNFKFEEKKSSEILTSNTLFVSVKDGKYGYVDKEGNVVIDYQYDDATEQNKFGFAGVKNRK